MIHGGGTTPISQTPDTDLNEHVRRECGELEAGVLINKMRDGEIVPKLRNEECMELMLQILTSKTLHKKAAEGFKKVGQNVDLHGKEDSLICREAVTIWNVPTTDGYINMRARIDVELAAVAEEIDDGGLTWSLRSVKRLIVPYPARSGKDRILANPG